MGRYILSWRSSTVKIRTDRWCSIEVICADIIQSITEATANGTAIIPTVGDKSNRGKKEIDIYSSQELKFADVMGYLLIKNIAKYAKYKL